MYKTICSTFIAAALAYFLIAYPNLLQANNLISNSNTTSRPEEMALTSVSRGVAKKVLAIETPEGAGALVRRSIGSMNLRNLTPFLMLDHFHITKGAVSTIVVNFTPDSYIFLLQGFPDHPHRGQATVTYMLEGSSRHEDSAGHKGTIEAGGVQWMTAGRGIMHAEMPISEDGAPEPRGLQLWVDLPKEVRYAISI